MPGPPNYDELRRAHEAALHPSPPSPNPPAPQPVSPSPSELALSRVQQNEPQQTTAQAETDQRSVRDRHEAHRQHLRDANAKEVAKNGRAQETERLQQHARQIENMSRENATLLAEQARELGSIRHRFDTLGQNPFQKSDEFAPGGNKFAYEKNRHETAFSGQGKNIYVAEERAAGAEHAMFMREQNELSKEIENEPDLTKRNRLTMQQHIRAADHLAYTSHRIADQSEVLTGVEDNPTAAQYRERASAEEQRSLDIREKYKERDSANYKRSIESAENAAEHALKQRTHDAPSFQQSNSPAGELSDAKQTKLAKLREQFAEVSAEVTHEIDGFKRPPPGRGGAER